LRNSSEIEHDSDGTFVNMVPKCRV